MMQFKSKNINIVSLVAWLLYANFWNTSPSSISNLVNYWMVNNIMDGGYSIESGINLHWITTYSHTWSKLTIDIYKKNNIEAKYATKKHGKYYPNFDLKTCVHILLEMLGSYFFRILESLDILDTWIWT